MNWFDSHAHPESSHLADELSAMREAGVEGFVAVGTTVESSHRAIEVAESARALSVAAGATVGIHPHEASQAGPEGVEKLANLVDTSASLVVGIGECGLDYYYEYSDRDSQREVFKRQIALAKERNLALVIHTRSAWEDTFEVLETSDLPERVVMHCFVGSPTEARRCLELGFWISFSGIVTFKNAVDVREAALVVPMDRMLVETDSPYLAPVPYRGKPNKIANVRITGEYLAKLKGIEQERFATATRDNVRTVFGL